VFHDYREVCVSKLAMKTIENRPKQFTPTIPGLIIRRGEMGGGVVAEFDRFLSVRSCTL